MVQQHRSVYIEKYAQFCYSNIFPHAQTCTHTDAGGHVCARSFLILFLIFSGMLPFPPLAWPVSLLYKHIPAFCVTLNKISNFEQMALYRFASFLPHYLLLSLTLSVCLLDALWVCVCGSARANNRLLTNISKLSGHSVWVVASLIVAALRQL